MSEVPLYCRENDEWFRDEGRGRVSGVGGYDAFHCRTNVAQIRQSRPDSGISFQLQVVKTFQVVFSSLRSRVCREALGRNVKRFRGGLVFEAQRLWHLSTLGSRVLKKKKKEEAPQDSPRPSHQVYRH